MSDIIEKKLIENNNDLSELTKDDYIMNEMDNNDFCYIVQEREFARLKEDTYKIGKTSKGDKNRFMSYPKQSLLLLLLLKVDNCDVVESAIIKAFDNLFINRREYGREYYSGNINIMKKHFLYISEIATTYPFYFNIPKAQEQIKLSKQITHLKQETKDIIQNIKELKKEQKVLKKEVTSEKSIKDNVLEWFKDNYELTKNHKDLCKMKDLYDNFSSSAYFFHLTKNEKRKYNKSYFNDYVTTNIFFAEYHKIIHNNTRNCIVGWKKINNEENVNMHL